VVEVLSCNADICVANKENPCFVVPKVSVPRFQKLYGWSLTCSRGSVTVGMLFNVRVTCTWILLHFLAISCTCSISFGSWKRSRCRELEMTGMKVRSAGGRQFSPRPPDPVPVSTRKQKRASVAATINHMSAVWAYYDSPRIKLSSTWHRRNYNASSCTYRWSPEFFRTLHWMTQ